MHKDHEANNRWGQVISRIGISTLPIDQEEIKNLFYEFQTYQLELESQINNLKLIHAKVEADFRQYYDLMENSQDLICAHNLEGNLLFVNPAGTRLSGFSKSDLLNMNLSDLLAPNVHHKLGKYLEQIQTQGEAHGNLKIQTACGEIRYLEYNNKLHDDDVSAPIVYSIARDVTDRKRAEDAQRQAEIRYRSLFEQSHDAVFILDIQGRHLEANQRAAEMLGYSLDEIDKLSVVETSNELSQSLEIIARLLRGEQIPMYERLLRKKDGSPISVEINVELVRNVECEPLHIQSIVRDISERKQAEKELRENEEKFRRVIEHISDALIVDDINGNIVFANERFCALYGFQPDELPCIKLENYVAPEWQSELRDRHNQRIQGKPVPSHFEYEGIRKDGDRIWIEVDVITITDEAGKITGTQSALRNITERKHFEAVIRHYASELEKRVEVRTAELVSANHAKDEFLANMSHELRTPLNSILGFSEILLEGIRGTLTQRQEDAVQMIHSSGQHLLGLINDILDVSKIEAGKFEIHPEEVNVNEICKSSLMFIKDLAEKKSISVECTVSPTVTTIFADPRRLKQILVNLLHNAVKFTPERGKVGLDIRANMKEDMMLFSINDTGIGIAAENLPKLFTPFIQMDSSLSRQYDGSGLGLVLVKTLVDMHGGMVEVQSEVGVGSRFTFLLPWKQKIKGPNDSSLSKIEEKEINKQTETTSLQGKKILAADDNEINLMVVQGYLEACGCQVIVAHDGREAISKAQEFIPDIILMDIQMPDINGLEAARILRQDAQFARMPIIALTALAMPEDKQRCLNAGMDAYISKPFKIKELVELIRKFLEHAEL